MVIDFVGNSVVVSGIFIGILLMKNLVNKSFGVDEMILFSEVIWYLVSVDEEYYVW